MHLGLWRTFHCLNPATLHLHQPIISVGVPTSATFTLSTGQMGSTGLSQSSGKYNTINCAAGHHIMEGRWLRNQDIINSYAKWWVTDESRHNYYYWYAHALREHYSLNGDTALIKAVLPSYMEQFELYTKGLLPDHVNSYTTKAPI